MTAFAVGRGGALCGCFHYFDRYAWLSAERSVDTFVTTTKLRRLYGGRTPFLLNIGDSSSLKRWINLQGRITRSFRKTDDRSTKRFFSSSSFSRSISHFTLLNRQIKNQFGTHGSSNHGTKKMKSAKRPKNLSNTDKHSTNKVIVDKVVDQSQSGKRPSTIKFDYKINQIYNATTRLLTLQRLSNSFNNMASSLVIKFLAGFCLAIIIVPQYVVDVIMCEGPSMLPTIRPFGEIVLVDKLTHRLFCMEQRNLELGDRHVSGSRGSRGIDRASFARQRQRAWKRDQVTQKISKQQQQQQGENKAENSGQIETSRKGEESFEWYELANDRVGNSRTPNFGTWGKFWTKLSSGISKGDVVILQHPQREGTVCKRIIGLPGDIIIQPREMMTASNNHARLVRGRRRDWASDLVVVPDGHVWVEGDNSVNSLDSRTYGAVPAALIDGRVICRLWPLRGNAIVESGPRPVPRQGERFSGSTVLPAGYDGHSIELFDPLRKSKS